MYVWLVMDIKHNLLAYESSLSDGESQQVQNLGTWAETYISIFRLNNSFLWEVSIFVLTAFNWVSKTSLNIKVNLFLLWLLHDQRNAWLWSVISNSMLKV